MISGRDAAAPNTKAVPGIVPVSVPGAVLNLEVISRLPSTAAAPERPPLLFVHGICHGAWCWDEHFLGYFAAHGWAAHALSLRGHQNSDGASDLSRYRIADYVADVRTVSDSLPQRPILVGHSMGGAIVQKLLEDFDAPAAVLIASMPPSGGIRSMLRMLRRRPLTLLLSLADGQLLRMFATPERCRDAFFSRHTPEDLVARYMQLLTNESMRAAIDMLVTNRPRPERTHTVPMLVLGASDDGLFSADQIHATAARYHTTATIVDTTGHDMMLETTWRTTAQIINTWLKAQFELI